MDVVGGGEEHTDDVVVIDAVAFDHRFEQGDGSLLDLFSGIALDGGGAPKGPDARVHGIRY